MVGNTTLAKRHAVRLGTVSLSAMACALLVPAAAYAAPAATVDADVTADAAAVAAAQAPTAAAPAAEPAADGEVVVTGFRQSLQAAINLKKNSVAAVDAIVADSKPNALTAPPPERPKPNGWSHAAVVRAP